MQHGLLNLMAIYALKAVKTTRTTYTAGSAGGRSGSLPGTGAAGIAVLWGDIRFGVFWAHHSWLDAAHAQAEQRHQAHERQCGNKSPSIKVGMCNSMAAEWAVNLCQLFKQHWEAAVQRNA